LKGFPKARRDRWRIGEGRKKRKPPERVAGSGSSQDRCNGVGGAVNGAGRAEEAADLGKAGALFGCGGGIEEAVEFGGDFLRGEVILDKFRNDAAAGDEIDHAEELVRTSGLASAAVRAVRR